MDRSAPQPTSFDEYIKMLPDDVNSILKLLWKIVVELAGEAKEAISYLIVC